MLRLDVIRPVSELLDAQARERPDAQALRDEAATVTYGALAEGVARVAGHLRGLGIGPGDAVGLYMTNSTDWVQASLATVRAGAVSVPIPAQATPEEAAFMLADSGARLAFVDASHRDAAVEAVASLPGLDGLRLVTARSAGALPDGELAFEELLTGEPVERVR
jgi:long-chain acyl-CoA synthetase